MQPTVSMAPQMPARASLPAAPAASTVSAGATGFGDALVKFLDAAAPADSPAATTQAPTAVANPTPHSPADAAAQQPTPMPPEPQVASALPLPEMATPITRDAGPSKSFRASPSLRRAATTGVAALETPMDQPVATTAVQPLPVGMPAPETTPERTEPATPRQHTEPPKATDDAGPIPMASVAPGQPEAKPTALEAAPPQPLQDAPAIASAQPVASSPTDLAAAVLPTVPQPASQPAAPTEAGATASPRTASPAAQIAPALVQTSHAPDGAQRLTMRLEPPELGRVQVRIDRPAEAAARVEITVDKAETLTLLLRDQPQLQRALDQAGVPAEGRTVTFHVATPEPATASAPGMQAGGPSGDGSRGAPPHGGEPERQHAGTPDGTDTEFTPMMLPGWVRGGLDITA
ncbi:MAG TPA: flagellar hook-length control protein FliK [Acetobacteraceae bacterium]|nr:flagellar hook-length control protein FliK [Acetobacteraceae bacterium]